MDHTHHMHTNVQHAEMSHDHSHMHHGDDMHTVTCNMNMLFNWDTSNLCIIWHWWRIHGPISLVFSLLGVIAVTAMFEAVRAASRRYELWVKLQKENQPKTGFGCGAESPVSFRFTGHVGHLCSILNPAELIPYEDGAIAETAPLRSGQRLFNFNRRTHIFKAVLYAIQSFYGLMLMLIFMTYNGWVMICMFLGSLVGYLIFGQDTSATKDGACH